jgi:hypothetical protein
LGHACWPPPPACSLNHSQADSGIPLDSTRSEFALAGIRGVGGKRRKFILSSKLSS